MFYIEINSTISNIIIPKRNEATYRISPNSIVKLVKEDRNSIQIVIHLCNRFLLIFDEYFTWEWETHPAQNVFHITQNNENCLCVPKSLKFEVWTLLLTVIFVSFVHFTHILLLFRKSAKVTLISLDIIHIAIQFEY